jgi:hypothetical protein
MSAGGKRLISSVQTTSICSVESTGADDRKVRVMMRYRRCRQRNQSLPEWRVGINPKTEGNRFAEAFATGVVEAAAVQRTFYIPAFEKAVG